jgi:hypothetical protein
MENAPLPLQAPTVNTAAESLTSERSKLEHFTSASLTSSIFSSLNCEPAPPTILKLKITLSVGKMELLLGAEIETIGTGGGSPVGMGFKPGDSARRSHPERGRSAKEVREKTHTRAQQR